MICRNGKVIRHSFLVVLYLSFLFLLLLVVYGNAIGQKDGEIPSQLYQTAAKLFRKLVADEFFVGRKRDGYVPPDVPFAHMVAGVATAVALDGKRRPCTADALQCLVKVGLDGVSAEVNAKVFLLRPIAPEFAPYLEDECFPVVGNVEIRFCQEIPGRIRIRLHTRPKLAA